MTMINKIANRAKELPKVVQTQWVPLSDIPDEWKSQNGPNEGCVDILNKSGGRFPDSMFVEFFNMVNGRYTGTSRCYWQSASGHEISEPTHGSLPNHKSVV